MAPTSTYRRTAALMAALLVLTSALPLVHQVCAMGWMPMEAMACCPEGDSAMPMHHGEQKPAPCTEAPAPDVMADCCDLLTTEASADMPVVLPSVTSVAIAEADVWTAAPATLTPQYAGLSPPGVAPIAPPVHILFSCFLT